MEQQPLSHSHSRLILFAALGWGLFTSTLFYGVFIYGPGKVRMGAAGAVNPNALSESMPVIPPLSVSVANRLITGTITTISDNTLTVSEQGELVTTYQILLTDQTAFIQKMVEVEQDADASTGGGMVVEESILRQDLQTGDRVEVMVEEQTASMIAHSVTRIR